MKKTGILNARLAGAVAGLGHFDTIVVSDAGLPMPAGVEVIDLAVTLGMPTFCDVIQVLLGEMCIEGYTVAAEMRDQPHDVLAQMEALIPERVPCTEVTQDEFNRLAKSAKFVVRTGEAHHYCNVIFKCGCAF